MKFILDKPQQALSSLLTNLQTLICDSLSIGLSSIFGKSSPKGLYIYGPVGCGKSVLMEEFYNGLKIKNKLLIHYHDFMQQIHELIFAIRQEKEHALPVKIVAKQLAKEYKVICLDELEISDITDAMIVGKLFAELLANKVVIVTTSNRHPDELYQDGLQRAKFLEFIAIIKSELGLFYLNNDIDYRLSKINADQQFFFIPNNNENNQKIERLFADLCENHPPHPHVILLKGRSLTCDISYKNIAKFTFSELCRENLGPADYIALCKYYRIIILTDIPKLTAENNNEAARFVNLIDEIYEHSILLVCSAEAPLDQIYTKGGLSFKYQRTTSRLVEMQSQDYIIKAKKWHL